MFAAKLWFPVVLLFIAGALLLVLGTTKFSESVLPPYEAMTSSAAAGVEGKLLDASQKALDAAARASVQQDVRAALKNKAEPSEAAKAALLAPADGRFGAPTYALLVRADGTVGARMGGDSTELGEQLEGLPLVAEAMKGLGRDGLLTIGGKPVHAVSYPVYEGNTALGVVVLGWPYDAAFFEKLSDEVQGKVALLLPKEHIGASLDDVPDEQLRTVTRDTAVGPVNTGLPGGAPWLLESKDRWLASKVPFYAGDRTTSVVVAVDRTAAFQAIGLAQLAVVALTFVLGLVFAVIIGSTLRSISKPIQTIMDHLSQLQQGSAAGIIPERALSGPFVRLGKQINMLLQTMPSASRPGAAPLSSLGSGGLAGLGGMGAGSGSSGPPAPSDNGGDVNGGLRLDALLGSDGNGMFGSNPGGASQGGPSTSAGPGMLPGNPAGAGNVTSGLSNLFDEGGGDPLASFRVPPAATPAPTPAPTPRPQSSGGMQSLPNAPHGSGPMTAEATVMFQVPQELIERSTQDATIPPPGKRSGSAPPGPPPYQPPPQARPMMDDNRTVVAQVPYDLLAAAAPKSDISQADDAHYREVYDKFVETRQECAEDISDLTYDRFVQKLLKNRQQIIEKHKAKAVRFQVYVKDGKAALRALPVRE